MTPSTYTETEPEVQATPQVETLVLEEPKPKPRASSVIPARRMEDGSFQSSMIELNRMKSSTKAFDFVISLLVNLSLLAGPVLAGLYFTDTINLKQFASTFLIAPPPPPPPPPPPAAVAVRAAPADWAELPAAFPEELPVEPWAALSEASLGASRQPSPHPSRPRKTGRKRRCASAGACANRNS